MEPDPEGLDALAARAASRMDRAAFLAAVAERRAEFDGLLDDETLGLLVLDELGLNEGAVVRLADLDRHAEATVVVDVGRVHPPREFQREWGAGRVVNVDVSDATGSARLVLWNREARHVEDGDLREGARVKVVNARVKSSKWGLELHAGPWTRFEVDGALDPARRKLLLDTRPDYDPVEEMPEHLRDQPRPEGRGAVAEMPEHLRDQPRPEGRGAVEGRSVPAAEAATASPEPIPAAAEAASARAALGALPRDRPAVDVRARLLSLSDTRTFQRRDGSVGFVADATLEDETGRATLVCWDDAIKAVRKVALGTRLTVQDAEVRERNGRVELHAGRATRLVPEP